MLLGGPYQDIAYRAIREATFIVAVQCTRAAPTCFCVSMNAGPSAVKGFDLLLTEVVDDRRHGFLAEPGNETADAILSDAGASDASQGEITRTQREVARAAADQERWVRADGLHELLYRSYESRRWDDVAARCLACGNCTQICPTCFCTTVRDHSLVDGNEAERERIWDTCFALEYSYIHGGSIRTTIRARYRNWLMHKLATWIDQFGTSGCVGCGRCITWCPAGIDLTDEVHALWRLEEERHGRN